MAVIKLIFAVVVLLAMATSFVSSNEQLGDLGHFLTRRAVLLDDNFAPVRVQRSAPETPAVVLQRHRRDSGYAPPHPAPHKGSYKKGKVGPVYTFVKTDYNGNFKWGVRHRAGSQYAGGYH